MQSNAFSISTVALEAGTLSIAFATTIYMQRRNDALGPPANPIGFPRPRLALGSRMRVLCYNEATGAEELVENVLLRTNGGMDDIDPAIQYAYWRIPYRVSTRIRMLCSKQYDES
jgi:hypothetical protein